MKIMTKEELYDLISNDLAWRKKELFTHYGNLRTAQNVNIPIFLRSAIVMLYAHWEGFIKNAAINYLIFVKCQKLNLDQVSPNILAIALKQKLNEFALTNKTTLHIKFVDYIKNGFSDRVYYSENDAIKTESNLSSRILEEILTAIGVSYVPYSLKANLIDNQLLHYRNTIAHGNYLPIKPEDYDNLYSEVLSLLDQIFGDISNAAVLAKYKIP